MDMQLATIIGIFIVASIALIGSFRQMKPGFGPFNLRVVGIILVATFATVLALVDNGKISAAIGILGAIAGYLFGFQTVPKEE
ncbi:hypothetical protein [Marinobacterium arenosum]|uniref:hypothetical protein n=1 Tax=Marinobacterium arenosum TaxID=2862496 RepID=UPI001C98DF0D|nr:hypothetical protein [Marinobacterium arenosum]MBY4676192.1 hypothetical protein [Marinobacterium arenosum]